MVQTLEALKPLVLRRTSDVITASRAVDDYLTPAHDVSKRLQQAIIECGNWEGNLVHFLTVDESALVVEALHNKQCLEPKDLGEKWEQASAAHILIGYESLRGTAIHAQATTTLSQIALEGA